MELASPAVRVLDELEQRLPLHLLLPDMLVAVREVEGKTAEVQFLNEEVLLVRCWHVAK